MHSSNAFDGMIFIWGGIWIVVKLAQCEKTFVPIDLKLDFSSITTFSKFEQDSNA